MTARLREKCAELRLRAANLMASPPNRIRSATGKAYIDCAEEFAAILDAEGDGGAVGGEVDRVEAHKSVAAIDRWLRNNMDDEEYAEYSAELDRVFSYNPHPTRSGGVSDGDVACHFTPADAALLREAVSRLPTSRIDAGLNLAFRFDAAIQGETP